MASILLPGLSGELGIVPVRKGIRNGVVPPAPAMSDLAYLINQILAKRKKIVFRKSINQGDAYNSTPSADTWRSAFRTGPNVGKVRCRMILAPVDESEANAPDPRVLWTTQVEGGASTAQPTVRYNTRVASGYTITPNDWVTVTQDWSLAGNTSYLATLSQADKLRVLSATIWETMEYSYDTAVDVVVNPNGFALGLGIYDAGINDLVATLTTLWKQQGTNFFQWTRPGTTARTTSSTTYVNVLDTTVSAWATTSEGFYAYPQYHGALETFVSATSRETVPIVFWAYIAINDATATVTAALIDQNNGAGAPIATVTRTGATTGAFVLATANWSAPSNAAMKLDVMLKSSVNTATASIWAAGAYMYST